MADLDCAFADFTKRLEAARVKNGLTPRLFGLQGWLVRNGLRDGMPPQTYGGIAPIGLELWRAA